MSEVHVVSNQKTAHQQINRTTHSHPRIPPFFSHEHFCTYLLCTLNSSTSYFWCLLLFCVSSSITRSATSNNILNESASPQRLCIIQPHCVIDQYLLLSPYPPLQHCTTRPSANHTNNFKSYWELPANLETEHNRSIHPRSTHLLFLSTSLIHPVLSLWLLQLPLLWEQKAQHNTK